MFIKFNVERLKELSIERLGTNPDYMRFIELKKHKDLMQKELELKKSKME